MPPEPFDLDKLLVYARQYRITDVHLKTDRPPIVRLPEGLTLVEAPPVTGDQLEEVIARMLGTDDYQAFRDNGDADTSYVSPAAGRARVNCYLEQGRPAIALRLIPPRPPALTELNLPQQLAQLATYNDGLVILAGPTGSGKSTTLAGVIALINATQPVHIVTIEDPIEYLYDDDKAIITQREVGADTRNFHEALRRVLRQDPNVIVIGESRDAETMRTALSAAETGHLVFTTLHTTNVVETISRVLELFPVEQHDHVRGQLAGSLRAVVVQRMLPRTDGGRQVVQEIMFGHPRVSQAIADPDKTHTLEAIIADSQGYGMQTFNQALASMVLSGRLPAQTAMDHSPNAPELQIALRGQLGYDPVEGPSGPADLQVG